MENARNDSRPRRTAERTERRPAERFDAVVARIREDARTEPKRFLEESEVPAGGE